MTPSTEPLEIPFKRWRNKRKGYEVEVVGVYHTQNQHGLWHALVKAKSVDGRVTGWPGKTFLRYFEPIGRKLRVPSRWERIRRKDRF